MGDSVPYADASELCQQLEGLSIEFYKIFPNARFFFGGGYENKFYRITDIKPKNVLAAYNGAIFVIDADVAEVES